MLRKGDKGEKVIEAQGNLLRLGYTLPRWGKDGRLGDEGLAAARLFEQDRRLPVSPNGVINDLTLDALRTRSYKARGIDISHYQGALIDLYATAANGYRFIYLRSTLSRSTVDERVHENVEAAKKAGFVGVGLYHFWYPDRDPVEQAEHFHNIAVDTGLDMASCLPPVIDVERAVDMEADDIETKLDAMIIATGQLWDRVPCIYTSKRVYTEYRFDKTFTPQHREAYLWQVWWKSSVAPSFAPWVGGHHFQQTGFAKGCPGFPASMEVDRNLFNGDDVALAALL